MSRKHRYNPAGGGGEEDVSDAEFKPIRSFMIDEGQLSGLSPQECFTLGYELAMLDDLADKPEAIGRPIHADNRERIESKFKELGRPVSISWMQDDSSETWQWLDSPEWKQS